MTLYEKYSDQVRTILKSEPELDSRNIANRLRYKGNFESFSRIVVQKIRRELGVYHKKTPNNIHKVKSADEIISSRSTEAFDIFDENGEAFTDGYWIDPTPLKIPTGQRVLVVNDTHIGIHKVALCEAPFRYCKEQGIEIDTILLNGDIMDCGAVSSHAASPYENATIKDEKDQCRLYLRWIRGMFPKANIIYAEGNHEYRIARYMALHAKMFQGQIKFENYLGLHEFGITFVPYHSHVLLGHLNIMHGHHIKGSGENVAATLLKKAGVNIMFGDRHRVQEATTTRFDGSTIGAWAVGCLCPLVASYSLYNPQWANGFAIVDSKPDGTFAVRNLRIINGEVL